MPLNVHTNPSLEDEPGESYEWDALADFRPSAQVAAPPAGSYEDDDEAEEDEEAHNPFTDLLNGGGSALTGNGGGGPSRGTSAYPAGNGAASSSRRTPIWPEHRIHGPGHKLRVYQIAPTGRELEKGDLPASAAREDVMAYWGPGEYLVMPINTFGEAILPQPLALDLAADHLFFQRAGGAPSAGSASGGVPQQAPTFMPGVTGNGLEGLMAYFQHRDQLEANERMAADARRAAEEARLAEARDHLNGAQLGLADRTIDRTAGLFQRTFDAHIVRATQESEREWRRSEEAARREREASERYVAMNREGFNTFSQMLMASVERDRLAMERQAADARAEREERRQREERQAREDAARRDAQAKQDRDFQMMMMQMSMQQVKDRDPLAGLVKAGAIAAPLLPILDKMGVFEWVKDKVTAKPEPASAGPEGWLGFFSSLVEQGVEAYKATLEAGSFAEDEEDEEEYEDEDGVEYDENGYEIPQEATPQQAPPQGGYALPEHLPPQPPQMPKEQQEALVGLSAAYTPVGGPAALAALNQKKAEVGASGKGDMPEATAPVLDPSHPATRAGVPLPVQVKGRKVMKKLVEKIRGLPPEEWQKTVTAAVMYDKRNFPAYLAAVGIRFAGKEAGAPDGLLEQFIEGWKTLPEPTASLVKHIPIELPVAG